MNKSVFTLLLFFIYTGDVFSENILDDRVFEKELRQEKGLDKKALKEKELQRYSIFKEAEDCGETALAKKKDSGISITKSANCCGEQYVVIKGNKLSYVVSVPKEGEYRVWVRYVKPFQDNCSLNVELKQNNKTIKSVYLGNFIVEKSEESVELLNKYKVCFDKESVGYVTKSYNDFLWEYRDVKLSKGNLEIFISSQETENKIDCIYMTMYKNYLPKQDDMNKIWVRWKLNVTSDSEYYVSASGANHTFNTWYFMLGYIGREGLTKEKPKEEEFLSGGEWSPWIKMPDIQPSHHVKWDMTFSVTGIKSNIPISMDLEFSLLPGGGDICNTAKNEESAEGNFIVIMPKANNPNKRNEIFTHNQYLLRRTKDVEDISDRVPSLKKIMVIAQCGIRNPLPWVQETEMRIMKKAGVNFCGIGVNQNDDKQVKEYVELTSKFRLPYAGEMMHWMKNSGHIALDPNENLYHSMYRSAYSNYYKQKKPGSSMKLDRGINKVYIYNLGDEIGSSIGTESIRNNGFYLQEFRKYLKDKGFKPEFFGEKSWDDVYPKDYVLPYAEKLLNIYSRRLYFHTHEFRSYFTMLDYKAFTDAIGTIYGKDGIYVTANYQANPIQNGFMWGGGPDIFEMGRQRAFSMQWIEDWVGGGEQGIQDILFGLTFLRSSSQKHNLPYGGYLIDDCGSAEERFYAWAGSGSKVIYLYTYGPVYNYTGYTWEDDTTFIHEISRATQDFAKAEDIIYDGRMRKSRVAILYGKSDELWQMDEWNAKNFAIEERRKLFTALMHENVQVDLIEEEDIIQDNKHLNYEVIYAPCEVMKESCQKKLKDWVEKGGVLVGIIGAGSKNEYLERCDILNDVFGIKRRNKINTNPGIVRVVHNSTLPDTTFKTARDVRTKIALDKAETIAIFTDDSYPAIASNKFGKGRTYFYCFMPATAYYENRYRNCYWGWAPKEDTYSDYRKLVTLPIENIDEIRYFETDPKGIYANMFVSEKGIAIVIMSRLFDSSVKNYYVMENFTIRVKDAGNAKSVETAKGESVTYRIEGNDLIATFRLKDRDILIIRY